MMRSASAYMLSKAAFPLAIVSALLALASCVSPIPATELPATNPPPTATPAARPEYKPPDGNRVTKNFNRDWKYLEGDADEADARAYDDAGWTYVDQPHSTKFVKPEDPFAYAGVSWYRKHFTVNGAHAR
jgi:hypothetical protein